MWKAEIWMFLLESCALKRIDGEDNGKIKRHNHSKISHIASNMRTEYHLGCEQVDQKLQ